MGILEQAEEVRRALRTVSLDQERETEDGAELAIDVPDPRPTPEECAAERERRALVATAMRELTDRERTVIALRFAGWTLADVGMALAVGRARVQQIETVAVQIMRTTVVKK